MPHSRSPRSTPHREHSGYDNPYRSDDYDYFGATDSGYADPDRQGRLVPDEDGRSGARQRSVVGSDWGRRGEHEQSREARERERSSGEPQHRGRGPNNYRRSDERVRDEICHRLTRDEYLDASAIEVSVEDGNVHLAGTAPQRADRRRAEALAAQVSGVHDIRNTIRSPS